MRKERRYIKVYNSITERTDLTPSEKLVYGLLTSLDTKNDYIYAKNDFISKTLGISTDTVKRSLKALKNAKLIYIKNNNRYREIYLVKKPIEKISIEPEIDKALQDLYDKL